MESKGLKQTYAICILVMFIVGSNVVVGVSTGAGQDTWASVLIATLAAIPTVLVYARIAKLYPGESLYGMAVKALGKVAGTVVTVSFIWYALHLGSLVLRNLVEFTQVNLLHQTPRIAVLILIMAANAYLIKSGILTLGKLSVAMLGIFLVTVAITIVTSVNQMKAEYLLPILGIDIMPLLWDSLTIYSFPLAETVVFLSVAGTLNKSESPYKVYVKSILLGAMILIVIVVRNVMILGQEMMTSAFFPSYIAARIINVSDFFARIEGVIAINFIMSGIAKISVCLYAVVSGLAGIFHIENHKRLVIPVTICMMAFSEIIYSNLMEMFAWLSTYKIYALPFQVLLPVILWIGAEIKNKKQPRTSGMSDQAR